jgi:hypothetical protein
MDAFELAEAKRCLLQRRIIPVWVEFRTSVRSLIESYNRTEAGRVWNARLELAHDDRVLVVTRITELAHGQYSLITISIRAAVHEERFVIEAAKEKWVSRRIGTAVPERMDWTEYLFQLEGDLATEEVWLTYKEQRRSAFQCAEFLLFDALTENRFE